MIQQFHFWDGTEIRILKRYLHSCIHCSLIRNSQEMKITQMSTSTNGYGNRGIYIQRNIILP